MKNNEFSVYFLQIKNEAFHWTFEQGEKIFSFQQFEAISFYHIFFPTLTYEDLDSGKEFENYMAMQFGSITWIDIFTKQVHTECYPKYIYKKKKMINAEYCPCLAAHRFWPVKWQDFVLPLQQQQLPQLLQDYKCWMLQLHIHPFLHPKCVLICHYLKKRIL